MIVSPILLAASFPNVPVKLIVIPHPIPHIFFILFSGITASSCPPSQMFARTPPGRALTIPPSASLGMVGSEIIFTPIADDPIFATLFAMVMTKFILSIIQFMELTMVFFTVSHTEVTVQLIVSHIDPHAAFTGAASKLKVDANHAIHAETIHLRTAHADHSAETRLFHTATISIPIASKIAIVIPATSAAPNEKICFITSQVCARKFLTVSQFLYRATPAAINAAITPITIHTGADIAAIAVPRATAPGKITEDHNSPSIDHIDMRDFTAVTTGITANQIPTTAVMSPARAPTTSSIFFAISGLFDVHCVN